MVTSAPRRCGSCKSFHRKSGDMSCWGSCPLLCAVLSMVSPCVVCKDAVQIPDTFGCICHTQKEVRREGAAR